MKTSDIIVKVNPVCKECGHVNNINYMALVDLLKLLTGSPLCENCGWDLKIDDNVIIKEELKRCWINQPSTSQPFHVLHGENVLAIKKSVMIDGMKVETDTVSRIYFLSGDVISQDIFTVALSPGWKNNKSCALYKDYTKSCMALKKHEEELNKKK